MIQAGFFECDITPPLGADHPCAFSKTLIRKISDPLKIRALALCPRQRSPCPLAKHTFCDVIKTI